MASCSRAPGLGGAPLVPELARHLAEGIMPLREPAERHLGAVGSDPPFWACACAWAGGQALARYALDRPAEVAGRTSPRDAGSSRWPPPVPVPPAWSPPTSGRSPARSWR
ncbi:MAG TPA: hypothetical protein VGP02_07060 [Mycobacteriales bacterium]|nr:hypothetical protein [Mycobacteriales bacterium]